MPHAEGRGTPASDDLAHLPHVLREYALLADGERGALIGPRGDLVWMCFPRWDDAAVFATLIGGDGRYAITPAERFVWGGYYEPGSLIWHSRWATSSGIIECREALAYPGDPTRAVLLRRVSAKSTATEMQVALDVRADYGRAGIDELRQDEEGNWRLRAGKIHAVWSGAHQLRASNERRNGQGLSGTVALEQGQHHDFVLMLGQGDPGAAPDPELAWRATEAAWHEQVPRFENSVAPRDARHAYAVMSGLTSAGGGMVAAATMSLPERAQEGRSYDYRYVWIRDQCYAGQAVASAGAFDLLDDAVRFVRDRLLADGHDLKPAYTASGGSVPEERRLDLPGYPGGTDVVGNLVTDQFQLDVFGEALLLFAAAARHDHLDADGWRAAESAANAVAARWHEKDAGVWELDPAEWTHSRLTCAAGLRAISKLAAAGELASQWLALADAIVADIAPRAQRHDGAWQRAPDDQRVDAALLWPAIRGALPADDPRSIATLHAVETELAQDGYAYRYQLDDRPLGEAEGAFLLCGFLLALAHRQQGEHVRAARWFERNRAACGPPGLFSEEFDVLQRQLRGNLPQAFVHALLLECSVELGRAEIG